MVIYSESPINRSNSNTIIPDGLSTLNSSLHIHCISNSFIVAESVDERGDELVDEHVDEHVGKLVGKLVVKPVTKPVAELHNFP